MAETPTSENEQNDAPTEESAVASEPAAEEAVASEPEAAAPRRRVFQPEAEAAPDASGKKKKRPQRGKGGGGGDRAHARREAQAIKNSDTGGDFAAMFEAFDGGGSVQRSEYEPGQSVTGTVLKTGAEFAFVELGGKTEAYLPVSELMDKEGNLTITEGDEVTARVIRIERGGGVRLGTRAGAGSVEVEEAYHAGVPVSGKVSGVNKGGFEVEVMGQRGFCPISHIDSAYTEDPSVHVGATYDFKIIEYAESGRKLVVSRSALLKEIAEERAVEIRKVLAVDAVLPGTVRTLQDYGAFVDLGGIDGLVHVSEISHTRVNHPSEVLTVGQEVECKVLSIESTRKGERISLSLKAAQSDPWETLDEWLKPGDKLEGLVVRLAPFGAFIELRPGIEGLIHVSEMSWEKRIHHPKDVVSEGDTVVVSVLNIEHESRRIGLSLKAALGDPWEGASERFELGSEITGTVESIAEFGVFVKVDQGIVGLIPLRELGTRPGTPPARDFSAGQEVTVKIIGIEEERRRMSLSRREDAEIVGVGRGVQRRREGGEADAGDPGRGRGGGGRGGRERRGGGGGGQTYREAGGNFATLGDLLSEAKGKRGKRN